MAAAQRKDLELDSTWRKDQSYYGTLEADLSADTLLRAGVSYSQRDSNVGWADKAPLYDDYSVAGKRSDFFGASWNHDRYANTNVFASLEHKLGQDWKLTATGSFDHNTARVLSGELFGNVDKATNTATFGTTNTDYYEDNQSYDLNATGKYTLLGRQHDLVIGANYSRMYNYGTSYYGTDNLFNFQTIDIWNYSYAKPSWSGLPEHTSKGAVVQRQYGIYGNTRFHLTDALTAIVGARVSWWDTRYQQDQTYNPFGNASSSDAYKKKVTPYAGLVADVDDAHSVYASYSTIFQPQALRTPSGELLKPMEGEQFEVGVKGNYLDGRLQTSAALYQITQSNRALPTDDTGQFFAAAGKRARAAWTCAPPARSRRAGPSWPDIRTTTASTWTRPAWIPAPRRSRRSPPSTCSGSGPTTACPATSVAGKWAAASMPPASCSAAAEPPRSRRAASTPRMRASPTRSIRT
ncbi:TonB-dependent receptor [Achromobacter insuavis]